MFEKMGSADDLLEDTNKNQKNNAPTRAASVGRSYERRQSDSANKTTSVSPPNTGE